MAFLDRISGRKGATFVVAMTVLAGSAASALASSGEELPARPEAALPATAISTGADFGSLAGDRSRTDHRPSPPTATSGNFLLRRGDFTPLPDVPGALGTVDFGRNDRRQAVGGYVDAGGLGRGFLRSNGRFSPIDVPNATFTAARAVNNRGQVAGFYVDADGALHGFMRSRTGAFTMVDVPSARATAVYGMNDRGQVAGSFTDASDVQHGFVWDRGEVTVIDAPGAQNSPGGPGTRVDDINDRGQVVGSYADAQTTHVFLRSNGRFTTVDPPDALGAIPTAINDRSELAGLYLDTTGQIRGFLRTARGFTTVADAPGDRHDTVPAGINDRREIVIPPPCTIKGTEVEPGCPTLTEAPGSMQTTSALPDLSQGAG